MIADEDAKTKRCMLEITEKLQHPIPDLSTLLDLLATPLECLNLLRPQFEPYDKTWKSKDESTVLKYIPTIQRVLLEYVLPTWDVILEDNGTFGLLEHFFVPDNKTTPISGQVAIAAYSSLMAVRLTEQAIRLLQHLVIEYPLDKLHTSIFLRSDLGNDARLLLWEDCVKNVLMVPAKVANVTQGKRDYAPELEHGTYFSNISLSTEFLIYSLSSKLYSESIVSVSYLLFRLVNIGLFPPYPPVPPSEPSFFRTTLPILRSRLASHTISNSYQLYWSHLLRNVSTGQAVQSILRSLFSSIGKVNTSLNADASSRSYIRKESRILHGIIGCLTPGEQELWEYSTNLMIRNDWDESHARIFVCWVSGGCGETSIIDISVLAAFLDLVIDLWSSAEHVKHSLLSYQHYVTSLLIITLSYIRSTEHVQAIAHSSTFIQGVSHYISHLDPSVRRCGMLAAEIVAIFSGKTLNFKDWKGDDPDRLWARNIRQLIEERYVDADATEEVYGYNEVETKMPNQAVEEQVSNFNKIAFVNHRGYDSDDSATGYVSPASSRSTSPTPTDLDELEKEPTLNVGKKRVPRPAYLVQLGGLLRGIHKNELDKPHEADEQEMALTCAEALIRKKRDYGVELGENAANLVYGLLSLQDNFDLLHFEEMRQAALTALVACAPKQAAPVLIEEFFKNQYSTTQRFALLNALSMGARELASLPLPSGIPDADNINTTMQNLKYSSKAIANLGDDNGIGTVNRQHSSVTISPTLIREERLRVRNAPTITEVTSTTSFATNSSSLAAKKVFYSDIAAQYFIMPLIHRFWGFLRDEQMREELTTHLEESQRYHGAGTGLILNAVIFAQYLRTVAIVVHAAQSAPEWLAIIAPSVLELAVTSGTRRLSSTRSDVDNELSNSEQQGTEASVLTSALELALVVLDGCLELDGGQSLSLEHTMLLLGAGDWAGKVFASLEKGLKAEGMGGLHEIKLKSVAAGVLLKVDELTSRWRRSMIDL